MVILIAAGALIGAVPIQQKGLYGFGMEVHIGTPATKLFMAPDFASAESRIFAAAEMRSPFRGPLLHSSSLRPAVRQPFPFLDNVTLAGVAFPAAGVSLEMERTLRDALHYPACDGRLGLGPQSAFARSHNLSLGLIGVSVGNETQEAIDLELTEALPQLNADQSDIIIPLYPGSTSWSVNASFSMNGLRVSATFGAVQLDPTAYGIEVPAAAMARLQVIVRMVSPETFLDGMGRLWAPCTADGRISVPLPLTMDFQSGDSLDVSRGLRRAVGGEVQQRTGSTGHVCPSQFRRGSGTHWRMDPLFAAGAERLFLDSINSRVVIRGNAAAVRIPTVPGIDVPVVPLFSSFVVSSPERNVTEVTFPARNERERGTPRYCLQQARPTVRADGTLMYIFSAVGDTQEAAPVQVPGVFKLTGTGELRINADNSVTLPLRNVETSSRGRKYRVSVQQSRVMLVIVAEPVGASGSAAISSPILERGNSLLATRPGAARVVPDKAI